MEDSSNFFERISKIIEYKRFSSVNDFARNGLGYQSSEKINRLKDTSKKPSVDILVDISKSFEDISTDWLLLGRGSMVRQKTVEPNNDPAVAEILRTISELEKVIADKDKIITAQQEVIGDLRNITEHYRSISERGRKTAG